MTLGIYNNGSDVQIEMLGKTSSKHFFSRKLSHLQQSLFYKLRKKRYILTRRTSSSLIATLVPRVPDLTTFPFLTQRCSHVIVMMYFHTFHSSAVVSFRMGVPVWLALTDGAHR